MGKRIVIALGGNALGKNLPEQMLAVKETSKAIADLVEAGHTVAVAHGNGPQVGMIQNAFAAYCRQEPSADVMPLSMCVAMSQGYIGYDLQNALREELLDRGLQQGVATVLTQVVVDGNDPAFQHPTKPIGAFMSQEEAENMAREKGWNVAEDAGRGWRQVVASPKPMAVVELTTKTLKLGGTVPAGEIYVDGAGVGDVGTVVMRDRKRLAEDGMVVVVLSMSSHDHRLLCEPEIVTRGFVYVKESEELLQELRELAMSTVDGMAARRRKDDNEVCRAVRSAVSSYLYKHTKRSPMIIPMVTKL